MKIIQSNIPYCTEYEKYDGLCSKIHYKFRSNFNLLRDLNEKCTVKLKLYICENLHRIITFQFNVFSLDNISQ